MKIDENKNSSGNWVDKWRNATLGKKISWIFWLISGVFLIALFGVMSAHTLVKNLVSGMAFTFLIILVITVITTLCVILKSKRENRKKVEDVSN